jgi:uncharacterized protein YcfJ
MKHTLLFAALGLAAFGAAAQEVGNVISSVPGIQQVAVPRTNCAPAAVQAQPQTSGFGGLASAVTGAGIGSAIGAGNGTAAAVLLGAVGGAILGNNIEANNIRAQQAATAVCATETSYENRTVAYNVTYEYAGRQYTVQMPYDPGPTVRLSVTPVAQGAVAPSGGGVVGGVVTAPPVQAAVPVQGVPQVQAAVVPAPVVVAPYPAYPAYPYPVYPAYRPFPIGVSIGFVGVFGGHRHHHRWR